MSVCYALVTVPIWMKFRTQMDWTSEKNISFCHDNRHTCVWSRVVKLVSVRKIRLGIDDWGKILDISLSQPRNLFLNYSLYSSFFQTTSACPLLESSTLIWWGLKTVESRQFYSNPYPAINYLYTSTSEIVWATRVRGYWAIKSFLRKRIRFIYC